MYFVIFSIFMCTFISRVEGGKHSTISFYFVREPESERAPSRSGMAYPFSPPFFSFYWNFSFFPLKIFYLKTNKKKEKNQKIIGNSMVQVGRKERSMELRLWASPEKVLTLVVPSLEGRAELRQSPDAQPPSGKEGRVTVVQGPERPEGQGLEGSQKVTGFLEGMPWVS